MTKFIDHRVRRKSFRALCTLHWTRTKKALSALVVNPKHVIPNTYQTINIFIQTVSQSSTLWRFSFSYTPLPRKFSEKQIALEIESKFITSTTTFRNYSILIYSPSFISIESIPSKNTVLTCRAPGLNRKNFTIHVNIFNNFWNLNKKHVLSLTMFRVAQLLYTE